MRYIYIFMLYFSITLFAQDIGTTSITLPGEQAGKWLATITSGDGVPKDSALLLRNALVDVFSNVKGGFYKHSMDIDDYNPKNGEPTKQNVIYLFDQLKLKIATYRQQYPQAKTMLVIGIAAHGIDENGEYYLLLKKDKVTGKEIASFIKSLEIDETLLILQSCQSGGLVNDDLPDGINVIGQEISDQAQRFAMKLAVATPVSRYINSPIDTWEEDILRPSFFTEEVDLDKNGVVTYEEWKNQVIQLACGHKEFVPKKAFAAAYYSEKFPTSGIDPQFFDKLMPAKLPLFLTKAGIEKYKQKTLKLAPYDNIPAQLSEKTQQIHKTLSDLFLFLYNASQQEIIAKINASQGVVLYKSICFLRLNVGYSPELLSAIFAAFKKTNHLKIKNEVLTLMTDYSYKKGNSHYDRIAKEITSKKTYLQQKPYIQLKIVKAIGNIAIKEHLSLLQELLLHSKDKKIRASSALSIGLLREKKAIFVLMETLPLQKDASVRSNIITSLNILKAKKAIPIILNSFRYDQSEEVKISAAKALGDFKVQKATVYLLKAFQNNPGDLFKLALIPALANLQETTIIPECIKLLKHKDFSLRVEAIKALAKLNAKKAIFPLIHLLSEKTSVGTRLAAMNALKQLKAKEAINILHRLSVEDPHPVIKAKAKETLEYILKNS